MIKISYLIITLILFLILVQGGFYTLPNILSGIILSTILIFKTDKIFLKETIYITLIFLLFFISLFVNNFSIEGLLTLVKPLVFFLFWLLISNLDVKERKETLNKLVVSSIFIAFISILSYVGIIKIPGSVVAERMQFTFQYANATGIFFATIASIIYQQRDQYFKIYQFLPIVEIALYLTQSVGSIILYITAITVDILFFSKENKADIIKENITRILISIIFTAGIIVSKNYLLLFLTIMILLLLYTYYNQKLTNYFKKIYYIFLIPIIVSPLLLLRTFRFQQSIQTFIERIIQISDGIRALKSNLFFGVGPGNWSVQMPYWQSAEYNAQYIHNSYIHIAVEVGVLSLLFMFLLIITYLKKVKPINYRYLITPFVILIHGFVDITLLFMSINFILILLLLSNIEKGETLKKSKIYLKLSLLLLVIFLVSILVIQGNLNDFQREFQRGNYYFVINRLENKNLLLKNSNQAQILYGKSLLAKGDTQKAILELQKNIKKPNDVLLLVQIYKALGQEEKAIYLLLSELKEKPFVKKYHDHISLLIEREKDQDKKNMYQKELNEIVLKAKENRSFLAKYLTNQKYIKD